VQPALKRRLRWILHIALAVLGVGAVGLLVRHVGAARLLEAMRDCAPVLPIVFGLEIVRTLIDAWRAQLLYAASGKPVSMRRLIPIQIASYPMGLLLPAGGAASEAYKAAVLARDVGTPVAAATATTNPCVQLFGIAIVSVPCVLVAFEVWGLSGFTIAIIVQAVSAVALAVMIQLVTRHRLLGALAARLSQKAGDFVDSHRAAASGMAFFPLRSVGVAVLGRVVQLVQYGLLVVFAGASPWLTASVLALGVQLVAGAAGDLVPAQIGATDASFALAAEPLGILPAQALSIAFTIHLVQIGWALVAIFTPFARLARSQTHEGLGGMPHDANSRSGGFGVGGPTPYDPLRGTTPPSLDAAASDAS
jgi:hypothetical protein